VNNFKGQVMPQEMNSLQLKISLIESLFLID